MERLESCAPCLFFKRRYKKCTRSKKSWWRNRGEIAVRIFRACNELGLKTLAIHSREDMYSLFRTKADESYLVGENLSPLAAYLDIDRIITLAQRKHVDAIHPGYGFLSVKSPILQQPARKQGSFSSARLPMSCRRSAIKSMPSKLQNAAMCRPFQEARHRCSLWRKPLPWRRNSDIQSSSKRQPAAEAAACALQTTKQS